MENNEDIKIVKELLKLYSVCDFETEYVEPEEKDIKAIENLLSRLKTAERMNDVLADEVEDLHSYLVEEYGCFSVDYSKDTENTSKQEILEWARKKVEDEL